MDVLCVLVYVVCLGVLGKVHAYYIEDATLENPRSSYIGNENDVEPDFRYYTCEMWGARKPKDSNKLKTPVPFVVVHHTYLPEACYTEETCMKAMRSMQDFHMDTRHWFDIGYNFCVGSDGAVYEGRGWKTLGAHSLHFNTVSLGICLIGNWNDTLPPPKQMKVALQLIEVGQNKGIIKEDYKLVGHRQVRETECPGDALYQEIQTWPHYSEYPKTFIDLLDIEDIAESSKIEIKNNIEAASKKATTDNTTDKIVPISS